MTPRPALARLITVIEGGTGFGFLGLMISYLPTLYGAFSQRELNISLLDARAGSPPTAAELLRRHAQFEDSEILVPFLRDWEIWSAQLMESHLSYPVLCYFRSQHDNQSWLAAFTTVLDVCALLIAYGEGTAKWQSRLTFAIARHAVVDLAEVLRVAPFQPAQDRLPPNEVPQVRNLLVECRPSSKCGGEGDKKLIELREYVRALFEWAFLAPSDAASVLGSRGAFRGKLEAHGVGKNIFGAGRVREHGQRIKSFLSCGFCGAGFPPAAFAMCSEKCGEMRAEQKKNAGGTPAPLKAC